MSNNVLLHRANIADGLRALLLAQHRFAGQVEQDSYGAGYNQGFQDAILAVAQMTGVGQDVEATNTVTLTKR